MKQIKVYLPDKVVSSLPLYMRARGFEEVSPYIRELILNDFNNIGKSGISTALKNVILDHFKQLENIIENNSTEILQRSFIQTKIILELMMRSSDKSLQPLSNDLLQQIVNNFVEESKKKYPKK
jgi:hypothetical protein